MPKSYDVQIEEITIKIQNYKQKIKDIKEKKLKNIYKRSKAKYLNWEDKKAIEKMIKSDVPTEEIIAFVNEKINSYPIFK